MGAVPQASSCEGPEPDRGSRLLVLAARLAGRDGARAALALAQAGVASEGAVAFLAAVALLRLGSCGTIALRAPGASALSRDEQMLVDAVAALQRGAPWRAQRVVAEWLSPNLAVRGIALLATAAAAFARAGLLLRPGSLGALPRHGNA